MKGEGLTAKFIGIGILELFSIIFRKKWKFSLYFAENELPLHKI